jgi:hypothetical protein
MPLGPVFLFIDEGNSQILYNGKRCKKLAALWSVANAKPRDSEWL